MTNDELPVGLSAPENLISESHDTIGEASASDAPPVKSSRRRRSQSTGTDAASNTETPLSTPRATRRKKPTETLVSGDSPTETPSPTTDGAEGIAVPNSRPRRAPRKKGEPVLNVETPALSAAVPDEVTIKPTRLRRGRSTLPAPTPPEVPVEPIAETSSNATLEPASVSSEPPVRRRRSNRRPPREGRPNEPVSTSHEATALPSIDESSVVQAEAPLVSAETAEESPATRSRRNRRRRERVAPANSPKGEIAEVTLGASLETTIESESSEESTTEEGEGASEDAATSANRRNRRKRGGRTRRGRGDAVTAEEVDAEEEREEIPAVQPSVFAPVVEELPPIDTRVGAHLLFVEGVPEIRIDNVLYPPVLFFGNLDEADNRARVLSEVKRAARADVHLHSTLIELPCPLVEDSSILDEFDNRVRGILEADPDGFVMPRLVFVPAKGWRREYPHEIATYNGEPSSDPSLTSERFWQEVERSLLTLVEHVSAQSWGPRIFGYHLERGEWFQPLDQGYDRSTANRDAFRDWLRAKYTDNIVTLRAAWHDGSVQFHTADIPAMITKPNQLRAFYESRRERRYIDFQEFTADSTARRMASLARVIKRVTNYQVLVSVCYGYLLEFGHGFSGHLALGKVLRSPHIDILSGPPSYRDRKPGGGASVPAPIQSVLLHKKLWFSEDDTKTYLAPAQQSPEDFNPRLNDRFTTDQAHVRAMGRALTLNSGVGWMDLWGEGWLDEESLWDRIGNFTATYLNNLRLPPSAKPVDVIALIDERSLLHVQRGEVFFRKLTNGVRDLFQRAAVSYSLYLQEDVTHANFPTDAKLYIFVTPYRLTEAQQSAIREKLQNRGKTLVYIYAPNSCEERPVAGMGQEEVTTTVTGITLRQQEWNSEVGSRIIMPHHPITERMQFREFGVRERLNPCYYADDAGATVLAEYQGSGLPSLAVRDYKEWRSVFVGEPTLTMDLLRGLCRYAGVPIWVPAGEDLISIGNGWVMIHAMRDGQKTLRFPVTTGLYDFTERRVVSEQIREHRFFLRYGQTRLFRMGSLDDFRALNLPNVNTPGRAQDRTSTDFEPEEEREEVQERQVESVQVFEPQAHEPNLSTDLATLQAILSMEPEELDEDAPTNIDDLDGNGLEMEMKSLALEPGKELPDVSDILSFQRRRRRRGGRGRGRNRPGEGGEAGGDASDANGGA